MEDAAESFRSLSGRESGSEIEGERERGGGGGRERSNEVQ